MLNSEQITALRVVVEEGSFHKAAQRLHVTSSAISQRIKLLETTVGQVLLERTSPCTPTTAGTALIVYARQAEHLEEDALFKIQESSERGHSSTKASIAVNADSIATWFLPALSELALLGVEFDIQIEDQDHTRNLIEEGRVIGAVTSHAIAIQGCRVTPLGEMEYLAVASPKFVRKYFKTGLTPETLNKAPMLIYNRKDQLQERFLKTITKRKLSPPKHYLPSSQAFVTASLLNLGWGMNPRQLVSEYLQSGELVEIVPNTSLKISLFWQCWGIETQFLNKLTKAICDASGKIVNK